MVEPLRLCVRTLEAVRGVLFTHSEAEIMREFAKRFTSLRHGDAHERIFSSATRGYASIVASPALSCITR